MDEFLQQIINGLSWGAIYALIAVGYTMVYGVLRLINFAHGEVYMVGAVAAYYAGTKWFKVPPTGPENRIWLVLVCGAFLAAGAASAWFWYLRSKKIEAALGPAPWPPHWRKIAWAIGAAAVCGLLLAWFRPSIRPLWFDSIVVILLGIPLGLLAARLVESAARAPRRALISLATLLGVLVIAFAMRRWFRISEQSWLGLAVLLLTSMICAGLLGFLIELIAYRPLRNQPRINALITAIGVSMLLQYTFQHENVFGASPQAFPVQVMPKLLPGSEQQPRLIARARGVSYESRGSALVAHWKKPHPQKSGELLTTEVRLDATDILILVVTVALMLVLRHIVMNTRTGLALRAVSFRFDTAALMGINTNRIISFSFVLGSVLAGAAGTLVGVRYPSVDALMGILIGLKAFVAAVLGGIGNIPGAVLGGFLLGLVETLVAGYMPGGSQYRDGIAFVILILVLLMKPSGLLGRNLAEKV